MLHETFNVFGTEWLWIILFAVVLLFGAKKIPEIARAFGRAKGEFERGKKDIDKEIKDMNEFSENQETDRTKLLKAAEALGIDTSGKSDEQVRNEIQGALKK